MSKNAVVLLLFFIVLSIVAEPLVTRGLAPTDQSMNLSPYSDFSQNLIVGGDSLMANSYIPAAPGRLRVDSRDLSEKSLLLRAVVTAYSSAPEETKLDNQFITASGSYVRFGVAASNFLPIGTKIRMPNLFGEQVFVIEDRMNKRYNDRIDIWMPDKDQAREFGVKRSDIEIL